ncbi:MAG: DUF721 domain-containing protein [Acidimicrobiia bacterium]
MSYISNFTADELIDLEEVENTCAKTTLTIKQCVEQFSNSSANTNVLVISNIHEIWESIVGSDVSANVKVKYIRNGVLYLTAKHGAWVTQINYMSQNILDRINEISNVEKINSISVGIKL